MSIYTLGIETPSSLGNILTTASFHEEVKESVEKKTFQTIQLYQNLTDTMKDIHEAIIQCITSTLSELKRSNTSVRLKLVCAELRTHVSGNLARPG